jgi:hypothetical protein
VAGELERVSGVRARGVVVGFGAVETASGRGGKERVQAQTNASRMREGSERDARVVMGVVSAPAHLHDLASWLM